MYPSLVSRGELFCSISCYMHHTCISALWDMYDSYFDSPHFLVDLACFTGLFQIFNLNVFSIESSVLKHVMVALDCFSVVYYGICICICSIYCSCYGDQVVTCTLSHNTTL